MFRREKVVDGYCYVLAYNNHHIDLYVDIPKSPRKPPVVYDPLDNFYDYDSEVYSRIDNRQVMQVKSFVDAFIRDLISKENPYYFMYSANEDSKVRVYRRYAERIASRYGYFLSVEGRTFKFYKI